MDASTWRRGGTLGARGSFSAHGAGGTARGGGRGGHLEVRKGDFPVKAGCGGHLEVLEVQHAYLVRERRASV